MILALQAALLGVVQGLTEFIPVSSTGHLILIQNAFGWKDMGIAFDVALHLGTLLAIILFFRREWVAVVKGFFRSLVARPSSWDLESRLAWMLILATIPAALAGALLDNLIENHLRTSALVAVFLVAGGMLMLSAERWGSRSRDFEGLLPRDAAVVGCSQVIALFPGISRSGATISAGMFTGLDREAAAKFAFMLAGPVIIGAAAWESFEVAKHGLGPTTAAAMTVGFLTSLIAGLLAVRYLLSYLRKGSLKPFVWYRFALAAVVFIVLAAT